MISLTNKLSAEKWICSGDCRGNAYLEANERKYNHLITTLSPFSTQQFEIKERELLANHTSSSDNALIFRTALL